VAELQNELEAAGAGIIWVLEADESLTAGTADSCVRIMSDLEASRGWCVGDGQTMPTPGAFDESPFSEKRGFDMIVAPATMEVLWVTNHGSPSGNDNLDADEVLEAVEAAVEKVKAAR